ncbi:OLC1v1027528C1 [Oldenlandia corymbosa var. corymbosa]|uniref:OLC1v1027528C1 n=1 Tax=Oldenlandia corymbosa var. corymbosa TaxID=529605 RepID=A0AAV1CAW3_OLDCO|nr:OLC1v1027528C1 [Oldenlandia corymbosa var. corymbosa]
MEPFSLLKFWRTSSGSEADSVITHTTNVDVRCRAPETDEESDSEIDSDDDSFFDLELTRSTPDFSLVGEEEEDSIGNLLGLETPLKAKVFTVDSNSKPQSPISLLKSAPKFRVFLLGFRKPKPEKPEANIKSKEASKIASKEAKSKRFTINYCKDEEVSIGSLFSRDNSLRSKLQNERSVDYSMEDPTSKSLPKDQVPKYLKLIKPLYNRASRRYTHADPNWDQFSTVSPLSSPATLPSNSPRKFSSDERRGNRGAGFRIVGKHLGKSRSASSAVGMTASSPANRRDDSLLLQNDGIQSAILHCKRSFNSSSSIGKVSIPSDCSAVLRACHEKTMSQTFELNLFSERNRCSSI